MGLFPTTDEPRQQPNTASPRPRTAVTFALAPAVSAFPKDEFAGSQRGFFLNAPVEYGSPTARPQTAPHPPNSGALLSSPFQEQSTPFLARLNTRSPRARGHASPRSAEPTNSPLPSLAHARTTQERQYASPRASKLAGVNLQARQRKYFDSLHERCRSLEEARQLAQQRVHLLEFETRCLRFGDMHGQTIVDQLDGAVGKLEGENAEAYAEVSSLEVEVSEQTTRATDAEAELREARLSVAELREAVAALTQERDELIKLAEAEAQGAEMEPAEAQAVT